MLYIYNGVGDTTDNQPIYLFGQSEFSRYNE